MVVTLAERRRVHAFAKALDAGTAGPARVTGPPDPLDAELAQLLAVSDRLRAGALGGAAASGPGTAFRTALRERLVTEAAAMATAAESTAAPDVPAPRSAVDGGLVDLDSARRHRGRRRLAAAAASLALVAGGSGAAVAASRHALPGDPLYGLKRGTESAGLRLARGDVARGERHLDLARTRLDEVERLAGRPGRADDVVDTLATMDRETSDGTALLARVVVEDRDGAPLDALDDFLAAQRRDLAGAVARLSGTDAAAARGRESVALLDRVARRVADLRRWLACAACADTIVEDTLGPVPDLRAAPATAARRGTGASTPALTPGGAARAPAGGTAGTGGPGTSGSGAGQSGVGSGGAGSGGMGPGGVGVPGTGSTPVPGTGSTLPGVQDALPSVPTLPAAPLPGPTASSNGGSTPAPVPAPLQSALPTVLPSAQPTLLPTVLPTGLPTGLTGGAQDGTPDVPSLP